MKKHLSFLLLICLSSGFVFSQSETNQDGSILLRHEKAYTFNVNSAGWGVGYAHSTFQTAFKRRRLEAEFVSIKHSKEIKSINVYYQNSRSFVFGKLNYFYVLRGGYGLQKTLHTKPFLNGVEVRRITTAGFSAGLSKPVYLYVAVPDSFISGRDNFLAERYDPQKHSPHSIKGRGPFNKGFDELGFYPGAHLRFAYNFEFGQNYESIRVLEAGVLGELFARPVPIMAGVNADYLFIHFYIAFHFGRRYNR